MAIKRVKVTVTKKNCLFGIPQNISGCPIALALKKKGFKNIAVDEDQILVSKKGEYFTSKVVKAARRFIERFDEGLSVKPFSFNLTLKP